MIVTRRLVIHGRVQGVGYRNAMVKIAKQLGLTGWVRNRSNGTVEAVVEGAPGVVEHVVAWAWEGPKRAVVNQVEVFEDQNSSESHTDFSQYPTL